MAMAYKTSQTGNSGGVTPKRYSFKIDFYKLEKKQKADLKKEILATLGFVNHTSFYNRLNGDIVPSIHEKEVMDVLLAKYSVRWDYEHEAEQPTE